MRKLTRVRKKAYTTGLMEVDIRTSSSLFTPGWTRYRTLSVASETFEDDLALALAEGQHRAMAIKVMSR